jgi:hypothetical protein
VTTATVPMLPLVRDQARRWSAGWTTYTDGFDNNPDVEVFCGGENEKAATAAACWRQGNLLHFGFEQTPAEMNENGQRLLLNSIAYISQFTEDRPIAVTPSVFAGSTALPRTYLDRRLRDKGDASEASWIVAPELFKKLSAMKSDELRKWHAENRSYLHPGNNAEKKLDIDEDARSLAIPIDRPEFFEKCIASLDGSDAAKARTLLTRYAPIATFESGSDWKKWFAENKPYLFFSDQGDYRWYVDPLAKKRGIPSAQLRGPARASKSNAVASK